MTQHSNMQLFDDTNCSLGEGAFWHPIRREFFWFDINKMRLHTTGTHWQFDEHISAAGWIDRDHLLIASETSLSQFHIETGETEFICALEAENTVTRSNDGRADPQGGFWIGTMGKKIEPRAGAIYRYYRGALRRLFSGITIPNAICFAPTGDRAFYCDTPLQQIMLQDLDSDGWPKGDPRLHIDLRGTEFNPDGAVMDADGNLWNAQWGVGRVACYGPNGAFLRAVDVPATQASCPGFGGAELRDLYCTTAAEGLEGSADGQTFRLLDVAQGQAEHRIEI